MQKMTCAMSKTVLHYDYYHTLCIGEVTNGTKCRIQCCKKSHLMFSQSASVKKKKKVEAK